MYVSQVYLMKNKRLKKQKAYFLVVYTETNWHSQSFEFLSLKNSSPGLFWGAPTQADITEFQNFLLQLKNQRSGNKNVCGFSFCYFNFERNYDI